MSQDVLFELIDSTAIITLNRPDKLNAWTEAMRGELIGYLEGLKGNDEIRTVILTGSGRAFCAGQDLAETASMNPEDHESAEAWIDGFDRLYRAVRNLDQITIAAVNGVAAGSGFQYSLLADLRVGDSKVRMGQPEVLSGIPSITGIWAMWSILGKVQDLPIRPHRRAGGCCRGPAARPPELPGGRRRRAGLRQGPRLPFEPPSPGRSPPDEEPPAQPGRRRPRRCDGRSQARSPRGLWHR